MTSKGKTIRFASVTKSIVNISSSLVYLLTDDGERACTRKTGMHFALTDKTKYVYTF